MIGQNHIVLASSSPIRQSILKGVNIPYSVRVGDVDEAVIKTQCREAGLAPKDIALRLAKAKAAAVNHGENEVILAADQIMVMDGALMDKPKDRDDLKTRLRAMRGRSHQLIGAQVCLSKNRAPWSHISVSTLTVRDFSNGWLDAYLALEGDGILYCVGGYKFEGMGAQLFSRVDGDYYAILGLELLPLMAHLRDIGALGA